MIKKYLSFLYLFSQMILLTFSGVATTYATNGTFQVTMSVLGECTVSGGALNFGAYESGNPANTGVTTSTTINVNCSGQRNFTLQVLNGTNDLGQNFIHQMSHGTATDKLQYIVDKQTIATSTTAGQAFDWTGTGMQDCQLYALLFGGQNVTSGAYSDTLTLQLTIN
jgi:spore coat protein U-like protein